MSSKSKSKSRHKNSKKSKSGSGSGPVLSPKKYRPFPNEIRQEKIVNLSVSLMVKKKGKKLDSSIYSFSEAKITHKSEKLRLGAVSLKSSPQYQYICERHGPYEDYLKFIGNYKIEPQQTDWLDAMIRSVNCANYNDFARQARVQAYEFGDILVLKNSLSIFYAAMMMYGGSTMIDVEIVSPTEFRGRDFVIRTKEDVKRLKDIYKNDKTGGYQIQHKNVFLDPDEKNRRGVIKSYFTTFKDIWPEWYLPLQLSKKFIQDVRTAPSFEPKPRYRDNNLRGETMWNYIIEPNLPDIRGKAVLDLGCGNGLYSYFMLRMGARLVHGIDRNQDIEQPTSNILPRQNVADQAYFTANLLCCLNDVSRRDIQFFDVDIPEFDWSKTWYDFVFAGTTLYHFEESMPRILKQLSKATDRIMLQTNLVQAKTIKQAGLVAQQDMLTEAGFNVIFVKSPDGYKLPIIYAERKKKSSRNKRKHSKKKKHSKKRNKKRSSRRSYDSDSDSDPYNSDSSVDSQATVWTEMTDPDWEPVIDKHKRCVECRKKAKKCKCSRNHQIAVRKGEQGKTINDYVMRRDQGLEEVYHGNQDQRATKLAHYREQQAAQLEEIERKKSRVKQLDYDKVRNDYDEGRGPKKRYSRKAQDKLIRVKGRDKLRTAETTIDRQRDDHIDLPDYYDRDYIHEAIDGKSDKTMFSRTMQSYGSDGNDDPYYNDDAEQYDSDSYTNEPEYYNQQSQYDQYHDQRDNYSSQYGSYGHQSYDDGNYGYDDGNYGYGNYGYDDGNYGYERY